MRIIKEGFTVGAKLLPVAEQGSALPKRFDLEVEVNVSSRRFNGVISDDQVLRARYARGNGTGSAALSVARRFNANSETITTYKATIANVDASVLKTGIRLALTGQGSDIALQGSSAAFPVRFCG